MSACTELDGQLSTVQILFPHTPSNPKDRLYQPMCGLKDIMLHFLLVTVANEPTRDTTSLTNNCHKNLVFK